MKVPNLCFQTENYKGSVKCALFYQTITEKERAYQMQQSSVFSQDSFVSKAPAPCKENISKRDVLKI